MKIICIGRNYRDHAAELKNAIPEEPVIFMKPESAILPPGIAFRLPQFSKEIHHEIEVVLRLGNPVSGPGNSGIQQKLPAADLNTNPNRKRALDCIESVTVGLDFTARDLQNKLKANGLPWEKAKAFDGSAVLGTWMPAADLDLNDLSISLRINDEERQSGHCRDLLFDFAYLISYISQFFTLQPGDLIFIGTPAGVGPVKAGDVLIGMLNGKGLFSLNITDDIAS